MKRLTYYRVALAAPILVPLVTAALAAVTPSVFGVAALFLGFSLLYAGLPYVLFALGVLWWARDRTAEFLVRLSLVAPLIVAPLAGLGTALLYAMGGRREDWGLMLENFVSGAILAIVFGYLYVAIVWLLDPSRRNSDPAMESREPAA